MEKEYTKEDMINAYNEGASAMKYACGNPYDYKWESFCKMKKDWVEDNLKTK